MTAPRSLNRPIVGIFLFEIISQVEIYGIIFMKDKILSELFMNTTKYEKDSNNTA